MPFTERIPFRRVFLSKKKRRNNSGHHRLFLGGKAAQICLFLQNFRVLFWSLSTSFGGQSCEIRVPRANYFHDTSPVVRKWQQVLDQTSGKFRPDCLSPLHKIVKRKGKLLAFSSGDDTTLWLEIRRLEFHDASSSLCVWGSSCAADLRPAFTFCPLKIIDQPHKSNDSRFLNEAQAKDINYAEQVDR